MMIRNAYTMAVFAAFLLAWSDSALPADEGLTMEQAKQAVDELVDSVGPAFDCKIFSVSVKALPRSEPSPRRYFIEYRAEGERCEEAHDALSDRGSEKGLTFWRLRETEQTDDAPREPNLDLINEINPPLDN